MSDDARVRKAGLDALVNELDRDAESSGYHLNPDRELVRSLAEGLAVNEGRYGYRACPCRLASGERESDLDIICPCDYRDPDLTEWGTCYCALYVSAAVKQGEREAVPVPERRPPEPERGGRERTSGRGQGGGAMGGGLPYPVWRCSVCGYLCARDRPPEACPICKASSDRFNLFA